jgi:fatty acid amide hydrolase
MDTLHTKSAVELGKLISTQQVSSRQVTQHFIDRIEEVNPHLNAVVIKLYEAALAKADLADSLTAKGESLGRLHGLPFTIKECLDLRGTPSTLGVEARKTDAPTADDLYVDALLNEGGIVLGKTNVPQLMVFIECVNRVYGRTNNPVNPAFSPGGSSGGEGAIVGAKASPVGIGTDLGGSVRFPAAFCGACSIKPTTGRSFDQTRFGDGPFVGVINPVTGVLANHAEDLDLFLNVISNAGATRWTAPPLSDFNAVDVSKLKIGYFLSDGLFEPMAAVKRGVEESVATLRGLGAEVVEFAPPGILTAEEIFYRVSTANEASLFDSILEGEKPLPQLANMMMLAKAGAAKRNVARKIAGLFGQRSLPRIISYFGGKGDEFLREWAKNLESYVKQFEAEMERRGIDAIISPVCALPAFMHNTTDRVGLGGTYTILYNVLGFPAGTARVSTVQDDEAKPRKAGFDIRERTAAKTEAMSAGMPLSVQIAARPWREDIVIKLIEALHQR